MMNTALKPPVSPQSSSVSNQLNKPMHPQGTSAFNQPTGHMSQNPYPNLNVAHNHPNVQQNHFSLNVPNAASHFNMGTIPASNHPVASLSQSAAGQQIFNQPKSANYSSSYQSNLGHPPNQNTIPPVCQTLPATSQIPSQQSQPNSSSQKTSGSPTTPASTPDTPIAEKPQSNGTPEPKTPPKSEGQSNHVSPPSPVPSQVTQASPVPTQQIEKLPEKAKTPILEQKPPPTESAKFVDPSTSPSKATSSINSEVVPLPTEEVKVVENTVPVRENQQAEKEEDLPPETDPLATEIEDSTSSTTDQSSNSIEKIENQPSSAPLKNKEETDEKPPEKSSNEITQESQLAAQPASSKSNDPETPVKQAATRTVKKTKTPKTETPKAEQTKPTKAEPKTPIQKSPGAGKIKRQRTRTQHYQSPLPEIEIVAKMTSATPRSKANDDRLIYFYKNEFLAVRNAEGGFYLCQAVQNIYKTSSKIKIRWLSQDKNDKSGEIYTPDFYDLTDFDCILTSLELQRVNKGKYRLLNAEKERTDSILKRCLAVEKGEITNPSVSEEHPDGLDLSLYKDEEQLKKRKGTKRKARSVSRNKEPSTTKSPDTPKVQKLEASQAKKVVAVGKKVTPKKATPEAKKPVVVSRSAKGKRKSDPKTSPVVDQKKAKVLAKIGRKTAIPASSNRAQTPVKSVKPPAKSTPTTSKPAVKPPVIANSKNSTSTRKTKRSTRK